MRVLLLRNGQSSFTPVLTACVMKRMKESAQIDKLFIAAAAYGMAWLARPLFHATSQRLICPSCPARPCGPVCQLLSLRRSRHQECLARGPAKVVLQARVAVRADRAADGDQFTDSVIEFHTVLSPFIHTDETTPKKDTALPRTHR
jgi:hypothetical protein